MHACISDLSNLTGKLSGRFFPLLVVSFEQRLAGKRILVAKLWKSLVISSEITLY